MDILREHHDAPLAGHPGIATTIELITRNYWFPGINSFIKDYVNSCHSCQQGKAPRHLRHGELAPLPVSDAPWKGLFCDFITDLPVSNGKDSILVFVDRMTKMTHFIPCSKSTSAPEFAQLFVSHIVNFTVYPIRSCRIVALFLLQISGLDSLQFSKSTRGNPPLFILKRTVKQNA